MKNVLTKMGYMVIGCLLTLIGYHFGNVENNSVSAQQSSESAATDIVGKIRVRQLEIVGNDNTSRIIVGTNLDGAEIKFVAEDNTPLIRLKTTSKGGKIAIQDLSGNDAIVADNNRISIEGPGEYAAVALTTDSDGNGIVVVSGQGNADSLPVASLSINEYGGEVRVTGNSGHPSAVLATDSDGNGIVVVSGQGNADSLPMASLSIDEYGGKVSVTGNSGHPSAILGTTPNGGLVEVLTESKRGAIMGAGKNHGFLEIPSKTPGEPLIFISGTDENEAFISSYVGDGRWKTTPWTQSENNEDIKSREYRIRIKRRTRKPLADGL